MEAITKYPDGYCLKIVCSRFFFFNIDFHLLLVSISLNNKPACKYFFKVNNYCSASGILKKKNV